MYEDILLDVLQRSIAEFTKINTDLAVTRKNLIASGSSADAITGAVAKREVAHREWSSFTGESGRE